jgi:hypothetical protein
MRILSMSLYSYYLHAAVTIMEIILG